MTELEMRIKELKKALEDAEKERKQIELKKEAEKKKRALEVKEVPYINSNLMETLKGISYPDPSDYFYYLDRSRRYLRLSDVIDGEDIYIASRIIEWNIEDYSLGLKDAGDREPIILWINSVGGDLKTSLSICDAIKKSITPIIAINLGVCYSGAALIFSCAHLRYGMPNSSFVLHEGYATKGGGTYQQMVAYQEDYDYQVNQMKEIFRNNLSLDTDEKQNIFETMFKKEWFLYTNDKGEGEHDPYYLGLTNTKTFPFEGLKD